MPEIAGLVKSHGWEQHPLFFLRLDYFPNFKNQTEKAEKAENDQKRPGIFCFKAVETLLCSILWK